MTDRTPKERADEAREWLNSVSDGSLGNEGNLCMEALDVWEREHEARESFSEIRALEDIERRRQAATQFPSTDTANNPTPDLREMATDIADENEKAFREMAEADHACADCLYSGGKPHELPCVECMGTDGAEQNGHPFWQPQSSPAADRLSVLEASSKGDAGLLGKYLAKIERLEERTKELTELCRGLLRRIQAIENGTPEHYKAQASHSEALGAVAAGIVRAPCGYMTDAGFCTKGAAGRPKEAQASRCTPDCRLHPEYVEFTSQPAYARFSMTWTCPCGNQHVETFPDQSMVAGYHPLPWVSFRISPNDERWFCSVKCLVKWLGYGPNAPKGEG